MALLEANERLDLADIAPGLSVHTCLALLRARLLESERPTPDRYVPAINRLFESRWEREAINGAGPAPSSAS